MTDLLKPRLDILPAEQRALWPKLAEVPAFFTLYGGTAIALQLGHRPSIDFDFFGSERFDPDTLQDEVPFLRGAEAVQKSASTLTCLVGDAARPVKLSFFGVPDLGRVTEPLRAEGNGLKVASLIDLAGTKVAVVQKRAEAKDYLDMDALIRSGIPLSDALAAGEILYRSQFNPQITLKALAYFGEPELDALPLAVKARLQRAVASVDPRHRPTIRRPTGGQGR